MSDQPQYEFVNGQWQPISNKPKEQYPANELYDQMLERGEIKPETAEQMKARANADDTQGFNKAFKAEMDGDEEFNNHFNLDQLVNQRQNFVAAAKRGQQTRPQVTPPDDSAGFNQAFNAQQYQTNTDPNAVAPAMPSDPGNYLDSLQRKPVPQPVNNQPRIVSPEVAKMALEKHQAGQLYLSPENVMKFKQIVGVK